MLRKLFILTLNFTLALGLSACTQLNNLNFLGFGRPAQRTDHPVAVATGEFHANKAAMEVLEKGGTAADAFIAAVAMLSNTKPQSLGLGGGFFALYYNAKDAKVYSIDAREEVPSTVNPRIFLKPPSEEGSAAADLYDANGVLRFFPERQGSAAAVGVPGTVDGFRLIKQNFGNPKLAWQDVFEPAMNIAEEGFIINGYLADIILNDSRESCLKIGFPRLALFPATRELLFKPLAETKTPRLICTGDKYFDLQPLQEGDFFINKDYARTLRLLSKEGPEVFYNGPIAKSIISLLTGANPGQADHQAGAGYNVLPSSMTERDLKNYRAVFREPIESKYTNHKNEHFEIYGMGPPASGGVAIAEMLSILDDPNTAGLDYDLTSFGNVVDIKRSTDQAQRDQVYRSVFMLSELSKHAFFDRNIYLSDEDFVSDLSIAKHALVHPTYGRKLREQILKYNQRDLVTKNFSSKFQIPMKLTSHDMLTRKNLLRETINQEGLSKGNDFRFKNNCHAGLDIPEDGTGHISIVDRYGNVLSATASIEAIFGNGMVLPGYGFFLNNELTDFDATLGHCNSIESGLRNRSTALGRTSFNEEAHKTLGSKRPRSSMSPTIVMQDKQPLMAIGAAGGWTIIGSTLQVMLNVIEHGMDLREAISAARIYNKNSGIIYLEPELHADDNLLAFLDSVYAAQGEQKKQNKKPITVGGKVPDPGDAAKDWQRVDVMKLRKHQATAETAVSNTPMTENHSGNALMPEETGVELVDDNKGRLLRPELSEQNSLGSGINEIVPQDDEDVNLAKTQKFAIMQKYRTAVEAIYIDREKNQAHAVDDPRRAGQGFLEK